MRVFNARSIVNKKHEINSMVDDSGPHVIGVNESWSNKDMADAELGLTGCAMFRADRIGRNGGEVNLYMKEYIETY